MGHVGQMTARPRKEAEQRVAMPAPVLATFVFLAMGGAVPIVLAYMPSWSQNGDAQGFLFATTILAAARYAWIVGSRTRRLFEMVMWLFVYFFLGVAPLVQLRIAIPGTTPGIELSQLIPASAAAFLGSLMVVVGSYVAGIRQKSTPVTLEPKPQKVRPGRVVLLMLVGFGAAAVYVQTVGFGNLFSSRIDLASTISLAFGDSPVTTIVRALATMGLLVAFVALMHLRRERRAEGVRWPGFLAFLTLVALLVIANPISSSRYGFGTVALAILAAFGAYSTLARFRFVAVSAVAAVLIVFPILDTFRYTLDASVEIPSPLDSLTTGDFDAFAQLVNTFELANTQGLALGRQLLGVLLFWVPRQVWPDKPIDTGVLLAEFKGYGFTNLSAPLWSEWYLNFGWVGLIVGMLAIGYLLRRADERSENQLAATGLPTVLGCVLPFYLLIVYRGSLLQATANLVVLLLASWWVTRPARAPREPRNRYASVARSARRF